jgi:enoyl-CoA hydratase
MLAPANPVVYDSHGPLPFNDGATMSTIPTFETILLTLEDHPPYQIAIVTLNRPTVLNALSRLVLDELEQAFLFLRHHPTVRAILLTGAGDKAFAAGADINEFVHLDALSGEALALRGQFVFRLIESSSRPVIACINGFALGGGCELALACTIRLASSTARLGQPEVKLGIMPGYGATQRLPRIVGASAALKLILTGEIIPAEEALRIGLVNEVVPPDELMPRANAIAHAIAAQAPLAVAASLESVRRGLDLTLEDALALEAQIFGGLADTHDKNEGVDAFLTKRKPHFAGK